ncbi:MAG: hypothetical protein WD768_23485 [Phycisphaeraceae bacterium]
MSIDIEFDGLTRSIEDVKSGRPIATVIRPWSTLSLASLQLVNAWRFRWNVEAAEAGRSVFALEAVGVAGVQGLISIEAQDGYAYVHLIENAPHNVGRRRRYKGVAGNLFAFACKHSIELGFEGFLCFLSKTALVDHYVSSLGARRVGSSARMTLDSATARTLVARYFKEYDQWPT